MTIQGFLNSDCKEGVQRSTFNVRRSPFTVQRSQFTGAVRTSVAFGGSLFFRQVVRFFSTAFTGPLTAVCRSSITYVLNPGRYLSPEPAPPYARAVVRCHTVQAGPEINQRFIFVMHSDGESRTANGER